MKTPYIKPTRFVHDSGFRTFEVGYCELGQNNNVVNKQVLGTYSDHIWIRGFEILGDNKIENINIDLTRDGYIRLFVHPEGSAKSKELQWERGVYSTAILKLVDIKGD